MNQPQDQLGDLHSMMAALIEESGNILDPNDPYDQIIAASLDSGGGVDRLKYWELLRAAPPELQLNVVGDSTSRHWRIVRPDLNLDKAGWFIFRSHYTHPDAEVSRIEAIRGLQWAINLEAVEFVKLVKAVGENDDGVGKSLIGDLMIARIKQGDHGFFLSVAKMLKLGDAPQPRNRRGDKSKMGPIFSAFCRLHIKNSKLPTKGEVRKECGLGSESEILSKVSRTLKILGLSGLPESNRMSAGSARRAFERAIRAQADGVRRRKPSP